VVDAWGERAELILLEVMQATGPPDFPVPIDRAFAIGDDAGPAIWLGPRVSPATVDDAVLAGRTYALQLLRHMDVPFVAVVWWVV